MLSVLLLILAQLIAPVHATSVDPVGSWTMHTVLNDEPGTITLVVAREKGALVADVTTLMGTTVRAQSLTFQNDHMTVTAYVHEGVVLSLEVDFRGNQVTGKWSTGGMSGDLKGERTVAQKK